MDDTTDEMDSRLASAGSASARAGRNESDSSWATVTGLCSSMRALVVLALVLAVLAVLAQYSTRLLSEALLWRREGMRRMVCDARAPAGMATLWRSTDSPPESDTLDRALRDDPPRPALLAADSASDCSMASLRLRRRGAATLSRGMAYGYATSEGAATHDVPCRLIDLGMGTYCRTTNNHNSNQHNSQLLVKMTIPLLLRGEAIELRERAFSPHHMLPYVTVHGSAAGPHPMTQVSACPSHHGLALE